MEFVEGKCPKCQGILQLPVDCKEVFCMYCGKNLSIADVISNTNEHNDLDNVSYHDNYQIAIDGVSAFISDVDNPMESFNKAAYETTFMDYYEKHKPILYAIENAYMLSKEQDLLLTRLASQMLSDAIADITGQSKKRETEQKLMDYNMILTVYTLPMILEYKRISSVPLADKILELWKTKFPKTNIQKASFADINGGFRKKLCYITTAVCESLNKSDDCYELQLLRGYRDNYVRNLPDGEELITCYYDIAPTIVTRINRHAKSQEIYMRIWKEYISPCVQYIENGQNNECIKNYVKMVNELRDTYILQTAQ